MRRSEEGCLAMVGIVHASFSTGSFATHGQRWSLSRREEDAGQEEEEDEEQQPALLW